MIRKESKILAEKIEPKAGSATILRDALIRISENKDVYFLEDRLLEIIDESLPERSTAEQWIVWHEDTDSYRKKITCKNISCDSSFYVNYFTGNTFYIAEVGFETCLGGGRIYRVVTTTGDGKETIVKDVKVYRTKYTVEEIG